jgi:hypothetical protein
MAFGSKGSKNPGLVTHGIMLRFAAYAPAALWLTYSYVPLEAPKGIVFRLSHLYKFSRNKFGYMSWAQTLVSARDTEDEPQRSPLMLFEDLKPLGPAHSPQEDIEEIGLGRFSHLERAGFFFVSPESGNQSPHLNEMEEKMILAKTVPLDGQHVRKFRLLHLRFEWGVWYKGVWYWDKPRFLWC